MKIGSSRTASRRRAPEVRRRGKPPAERLAWGLGTTIGHNHGPPLDDATPGYLWRRYRWAKAHTAAWKPPSIGILKLRLARAEAAGLSYHDYMAGLLDTGRHAQADDFDGERQRARARIRAAWAETLHRLNPNAPRMAAAIVLSSLMGAYSEAVRAYHNLAHVAAVLDHLDPHLRADTLDRHCVQMAALFHDMVYDPRRTDNEMASARAAEIHLADLGVDATHSLRIASMIAATRHRPKDVADADPPTALLLDCDLAILASAPQVYAAYARAIRLEYNHVAEATFRTGRARLLAAFLARPRIYGSKQLADRWEAAARANLAAECERLRST